MIQMGTILQVADNTGAKKIFCIKMLGGSTAGQYASLGDVITASVKEASPDGTVKKGAVVKAVIAYVPRTYDGSVCLLVPAGSAAQAGRRWSRFAHDVSIVPVPGDHRTCVTTHAETLGSALDAQLSAAAPARARPR